jgi:hypothetical protein
MKWIAAAIVVASMILSGTAYAISQETPKDGTITNYNYACGQPGYGDQCSTP